jgi:hypothetical protein
MTAPGIPNLDRVADACVVLAQQIADTDARDIPPWEKTHHAHKMLLPVIDAAGDAVRNAVNWMAEGDPTPARRPRRRRRWWARGRS